MEGNRTHRFAGGGALTAALLCSVAFWPAASLAQPFIVAPPSPPGGPMMIVGYGVAQTAGCADRDVILQGGCRSLTVNGNGDRIHAEMLPGGTIEIDGNGTSVDYFLREPGSGV